MTHNHCHQSCKQQRQQSNPAPLAH